MSSNHPLFDKVFEGKPEPTGPPLTGEDLKRSGMESVERHTPDWYRDAFAAAVEKFPRGKTFTVEDVREIVGDPPKGTHYNAMGPLMSMLARRKLAKTTGYFVNAKRVSMNATKLACWVRL